MWLGVILLFSSESGHKTHKTSKSLINKVIVVFENVTNIDIDNKKVMNKFDYSVRKCAHFTEYFVLGILIFLLFDSKEIKHKLLLCIFICLICASFDEIHQIFTFNRTPSLKDVILDTIGSVTSLLILFKKNYKSNIV